MARTRLNKKPDSAFSRALYQAAAKGDMAALEELSADIEFRPANDVAPALSAAMKQDLSLLEYLLDRGAPLNAPHTIHNPLHAAVESLNINAVCLLLSRGANANARDNQNKTPLHAAAENGFIDAAITLLRYEANIKLTDRAGSTPFLLAAKMGLPEMMALLYRGEDDLTYKNAIHETAETLAYQGGVMEDFREALEKRSLSHARQIKTVCQTTPQPPKRRKPGVRR